MPLTIARKDAARFWSKVNKAGPVNPILGTECWLWTACLHRSGYGQIGIAGRLLFAHRVAFLDAGGLIPTGLELDHLCRVRACVNPAHLEAVTRKENIARSPIAVPTINSAKTHCPQGHEYTPENTILQRKGSRLCRECGRQRSRAHKARRRAELKVAS